MGMNYYSDKSIYKLKVTLEKMSYLKDYPKEVFGVGLMVCFGMSKKKAIEWISNLETANKINIVNGVVNFV